MDTIAFAPIGIIHSPFTVLTEMPVQPAGAKDVQGEVHLREDLCAGLKDLDGFSHIMLLYHFHKNSGFSLSVTPFMDTVERGLFSTRAPRRPNAIGISVLRLTRIEGCVLHVLDVDVLDGTPLLDLKPYVPAFDNFDASRTGWMEHNVAKAADLRSDGRFVEANDNGLPGRD